MSHVVKKEICIVHLNVRSLLATSCDGPSRMDILLSTIVEHYDVDIFGLCETHLDSTINSNTIAFDGFTLFRKDRNRRGGGVAIYVKSSFMPELFIDPIEYETESVFVKIKICNKTCIIGECYIAPNQSAIQKSNIIESLGEQLNRAISYNNSNTLLVVMGDLNDRCKSWSSDHNDSEFGLSLVNLFNEFNLNQIVNSSTRGEIC